MKKYLVIGNPIEHSLSPKLHNYWFKKNNIDAIYEKKMTEANKINEIINDIKNEKLFGMNVTVPFKKEVINHIDALSGTAKKTNSVNTICKKNGKVYGDNTDVFGFEMSITNFNIETKGKTALIYGAGGVVPSIILALNNLGIKKIFITNRSSDPIKTIKLKFPDIEEININNNVNCDFYINATSLGLKESDKLDIDFNKIKPQKFFYDVIYNPPMTNFLSEAKKFGHKTLNGKMMFVYQAQKSFEIWHNILPTIDEELVNFLKND
jgi:shikimate dehydrogenase